jgi:photosystem II stability/assembly factor-like uncharacterized protein
MKSAILCIGVALSAGACKKSGGGGPGGGGGGGGGWLVGTDGMMLNVKNDGSTQGYNAATTETLNGIACRGDDEAWVVGTNGTVLRTGNGGVSWATQVVPTTADLRTLATQNEGPVFIAGDGVFLTSSDAGQSWTALGDGTVSFRSLSAAQDAATVLAVGEDGSIWSYEGQQLVKRDTVPGARAVAVAHDGVEAVLVGDNLLRRSADGGRTWSPISIADAATYDDVRIGEGGEALAVGTGGAVARITGNTAVMQRLGTADLHTVHLAEPSENADSVGYAAGEGGAVWMTRDGGSTWTQGPNAGRTVLGVDEVGAWHR